MKTKYKVALSVLVVAFLFALVTGIIKKNEYKEQKAAEQAAQQQIVVDPIVVDPISDTVNNAVNNAMNSVANSAVNNHKKKGITITISPVVIVGFCLWFFVFRKKK